MRIITLLKQLQGTGRSAEVARNILVSLLVKCVTIVVSLLLIPLTISYVNPTEYGIWLTLSGLIGWVTFFDLGLGNGFRNRFAEAKAVGDMKLAREYVSTTYFAISSIVSIVLLLALCSVLNISASYREELQRIFAIVCTFLCLNMVANIFSILLAADQKQFIASLIHALGQICSLLVVFILTKTTEGSLMNLALYYSGVPCIVMLISSALMYLFSHYRSVRPSLRTVRPSLVRNIMNLGVQFFIIYVCMILVFQIVKIVITREIGPVGVTQYEVANRYFNVLYMVMVIALTPFWSAFTDAYTKRDYAWMRASMNKLERAWFGVVSVGLLMLAASPIVYNVWIGPSVDIPFALSTTMLVYVCCLTLGAIYMYMINGIGAMRVQLYAYIALALISWPMLVLTARWFGLPGVTLMPAVANLVQAMLGRIQIKKILAGTAQGIWIK